MSNDQLSIKCQFINKVSIQVALAIVPNVYPVILIPSISLPVPMFISNKDYIQGARDIVVFFCIYFAYSALRYYHDYFNSWHLHRKQIHSDPKLKFTLFP